MRLAVAAARAEPEARERVQRLKAAYEATREDRGSYVHAVAGLRVIEAAARAGKLGKILRILAPDSDAVTLERTALDAILASVVKAAITHLEQVEGKALADPGVALEAVETQRCLPDMLRGALEAYDAFLEET